MGVSLDKIVQDLLLIIRGSSVSQSEPISKRQLEDWVHQYRAFLLKRDLDKNKMINPDYVQEISDLQLEMVQTSEDNDVESGSYITRTLEQLPKTLDLNHKSGIVYIGTILGDQIQLVPYNRFQLQKHRKYTGKDKIAFLRNQYLYVHNNELLEYINLRGVFENPLEIESFNDEDYRSNYPLPIDKVVTLKQLILSKELGIEAQSFSDDKNDSDHGVSPNTEDVKYSQNLRR